MRPQRIIQRRPGQRQRRTRNTPQHRIPRQRRRGVDAVAVQHVVIPVDEQRRVAHAKGHTRQDGPDPVDRLHAGPREPQLAGGDEQRAHAHDEDLGFGRRASRGRVGLVAVDDAADERLAEDDGEGADADAAVGEPGEAGRPAAVLREGDGVGDEAEVEDGVDDGDVDVPEDADGFGDGHDEGATEGTQH